MAVPGGYKYFDDNDDSDDETASFSTCSEGAEDPLAATPLTETFQSSSPDGQVPARTISTSSAVSAARVDDNACTSNVEAVEHLMSPPAPVSHAESAVKVTRDSPQQTQTAPQTASDHPAPSEVPWTDNSTNKEARIEACKAVASALVKCPTLQTGPASEVSALAPLCNKDLLSDVWVAGSAREGPSSTTYSLAWSPALNTLFIVFYASCLNADETAVNTCLATLKSRDHKPEAFSEAISLFVDDTPLHLVPYLLSHGICHVALTGHGGGASASVLAERICRDVLSRASGIGNVPGQEDPFQLISVPFYGLLSSPMPPMDSLYINQSETFSSAGSADFLKRADPTLLGSHAVTSDKTVDFYLDFKNKVPAALFVGARVTFNGELCKVRGAAVVDKGVGTRLHFTLSIGAKDGEIWSASIQAAFHDTYLYDVFGQVRRLDLDRIEFPSLTELGSPLSGRFIKSSMIRAVVEEMTLCHEKQSGRTSGNNESTEALKITGIIDGMLRNSIPELFMDKRASALEEVRRDWPTRGDQSLAVDPEAVLDRLAKAIIDDERSYRSKSGGVWKKVPSLDLWLEQGDKKVTSADWLANWERRRTSGHGIIMGTYLEAHLPTFSSALKKYSAATLEESRKVEKDRTSDHIRDLQSTMMAIQVILVTQMDAGGAWYVKGTLTAASIKGAMQILGWGAAFGFLTGGAGVAFALAGAGLMAADGAVRALYGRGAVSGGYAVYPYQLASVSQLLGLKVAASLAEQEQELCRAVQQRTAAKLVLELDSTLKQRSLEPENALKQSSTTTAFPYWLELVASIGKLRQLAGNITYFGAIGPSRQGKSTFLTKAFNLTDLNPGSSDSNRTVDVRARRLVQSEKRVVVLDFPGSNESDALVRGTTSTYAADLLHMFIVVVPYEEAHTSPVQKLLRDIGETFLRGVCPPCLVLLNKVDQVVNTAWLDDINEADKDMKKRIGHAVKPLKDGCGGKDTIRTTTATEITVDGVRRTVLHAADVPLRSLVRVAALDVDPRVKSAAVVDYVRMLVEQGKVWDVEAIKENWIRKVCPEALIMGKA